ncbi:uncharacterized protein EDB91DRAFT_1080296 [Suillus paluster]|uniref:uncharacterized protein n=1 Tax=Suillus paluster TaxID=48578 RepID=UPI001B867BD3|nr:uncharacterized protein EDB91DRAFT_1080296 [Suillus paluster]KAG1745366.1 hypothetical protein EDB91DRAFT_1080296 [Suillus paluster]
MWRGWVVSWFDVNRPKLKGWATLTEAKVQACIVVSSLLAGEMSPGLLTAIAYQIRDYNIDPKTAEHLLRYSVRSVTGDFNPSTGYGGWKGTDETVRFLLCTFGAVSLYQADSWAGYSVFDSSPVKRRPALFSLLSMDLFRRSASVIHDGLMEVIAAVLMAQQLNPNVPPPFDTREVRHRRFRDSPRLCYFGCGAIENAHHVFSQCPVFEVISRSHQQQLCDETYEFLVGETTPTMEV